MSAIAGILSKDTHSDVKEIVKKMCEIQSHRGPDGEGIILKNGVCFGHRKLEVAKSNTFISEPVFNEDKTVLITCDASIYNSHELRTSLIKKGRRLESDTDSEVILKLYEEFGIKCLEYLRGDFAFALWDEKKNILYMARDRFGVRPLFYYQNKNGSLLFASELKALIKTGMVEKELDLEAIYHYLFYTFFHQPQTPLKNVRSLLPGHYLTYNPNNRNIELSEYWDVPYSDNKTKDVEYLISEGRRILDESIRMRITKGASVGVSLSGGLDSSTIAAKIRSFGYPLKTYTFGFKGEGEELNEFDFARVVAKKIGSDHIEVIMTADDIIKDTEKIIWHFDTPNAGSILSYCLAKTAKEADVNVIFRGDGAHSAFEAPVEKKFLTLNRVLSILDLLPKQMKLVLYKKIGNCLTKLEPYARNKESNMAALTRLLSTYFQVITGGKNLDILFTEDERKKMFVEYFWEEDSSFKETSEIVMDIMEKVISPNIEEKMVYEELKRFPDQALTHISSVNGAFGRENRWPYYDHVFVEFAQKSIPLTLKTIFNPNKYLLRKIAEDVLPEETKKRSQHGFAMPFKAWLGKELKPIVEDVFSEQSIKRRGLFNYNIMRRVYEKYYHPGRAYVSWRKIWSLVILEMWFRLYYDPSDIQPPNFTIKEMLG